MDLRQITLQIIEHAFGIWRFRWVALGVAWLVALPGWYWAVSLPDEYDATAGVYVDTQSILQPLLRDMAVTRDTMTQVQLVTQLLVTRPQLEGVAVRTGLDARAATPEQYDRLISELRRQVSISQSRRSGIFNISYRDRDPVMARDVVQALLEGFMESSLGKDRTDSEQAQRFLEQQIRQYEQRLDAAEERRAAFRRQNVGLMPGQGGGYFSRLEAAEQAVRSVRAEIDSVAERRRVLLRQLDGSAAGDPESGLALEDIPTSLDADIARLQQDLTSLRAQFTERHPRIVSAQATLDNLLEMRDEERRRARTGGTLAAAGQQAATTVRGQLQVALNQTDMELASLQVQLRDREAQAQYLREMLDTIPEVEAQLARLDRDYNVVRQQYDQLVQRLERVRLGEDVQLDTEGVKFEVIEPPRVPLIPAGPNRQLFYSAVLVLSLGAGAAMAFLLSLHSPVYFSGQRLARHTGLPVFGMVSYAGGSRTLSVNLFLFALIGTGLVGMYFGLLAGGADILRDLRQFI